MSKLKLLSVLLVVVGLFFAGQYLVYGSAGLENPWRTNPGAKGNRAEGGLTMYGQEVLPGIATIDPTEDPVDPAYLMHFFLQLEYNRTQHIFTGLASTLIRHPADYGGAETLALHEFLKQVLVELTGGDSSPYFTCTPDPFGDGVAPPGVACPNILKGLEDIEDTEPAGDADELLAIMASVDLRIP